MIKMTKEEEIFENFTNIQMCFYWSDSYKQGLKNDLDLMSKKEKFNYGLELIIYYSMGFYKLVISDNDYYDFIDEYEKKLEKYAEKLNMIGEFDKIFDLINGFNFFCSKKKKIIKLIQIISNILGPSYEFILINYKN